MAGDIPTIPLVPGLPSIHELEKHSRLYALYRDYLKHEDDLINNRLNWNLTIQGFLFAAYSFTLQTASNIKLQLLMKTGATPITHLLNARELRITMIVLAWLGVGVSGGVYVSIRAARIAIEELVTKWHELYGKEYNPNPTDPIRPKDNIHGPYLPGLIGGGNFQAHKLGFYAPLLVPFAFIAAWLLLIIFVT